MIIPVDCAKLLYVTNTQKQSFKRDRLKNSQIGIVKKKCFNNPQKGRKGKLRKQTRNNKMVDLSPNISIIWK